MLPDRCWSGGKSPTGVAAGPYQLGASLLITSLHCPGNSAGAEFSTCACGKIGPDHEGDHGPEINFVTGNSVASLVSVWLVPSLGLLLACSDVARTQISSTRDRERVLPQVRAALEDRPTPSAAGDQTFARQVQDVLFLVRRQQPRTPQWFFELFHNDDEADFAYKKKVLEERHGLIRPAGSCQPPASCSPTHTAPSPPA